jgi:hypothetical protein
MKNATNLRQAGETTVADCPECGEMMAVTYGSQLRCPQGHYSLNPYVRGGKPGDPTVPGRCRDCGAWGPRDSRGLGCDCGCASE